MYRISLYATHNHPPNAPPSMRPVCHNQDIQIGQMRGVGPTSQGSFLIQGRAGTMAFVFDGERDADSMRESS